MTEVPNELDQLRSLPKDEMEAVIQSLPPSVALRLAFDWELWARPDQLPPPGDWFCWVPLGGRGAGKTRLGAEFIRATVEKSKTPIRVALIGQTAADVRDIMVEGDSGLLSVCPPWNRPLYEPSKRRLTWGNGSIATCYSGDKPDLLRGPQHHVAWVDELAKLKRPQETWAMMEYGLRLGDTPRVVCTTTPKPIPILKQLLSDPEVATTRVSTYANIANLSARFIARVIRRHEGTRLARQELHAEMLEDVPGALWHHTLIEETRVKVQPPLKRIVVAVDPQASEQDRESGTFDEERGLSETGIVVAGLGQDGHGYILDDLSDYYSPDHWARTAMKAYRVWKANVIVAEVNHGGAMVVSLIQTKDKRISVKDVRASTGKYRRAEPVVSLYEQGRVHHVGTYGDLEDQMCSFNQNDEESRRTHPDRMDALVWAIHELMVEDDVDTEKHSHYDPARHTFQVPMAA